MATHDIGPIRPVFTGDIRPTPLRTGPDITSQKAPAASGLALSDALDPGAPPVDADRVAEIRKAIEDGTYPLVPQKIADAMIAASFMLRTEK